MTRNEAIVDEKFAQEEDGPVDDVEKTPEQVQQNDATAPAPARPPMFDVPDGGLTAWLQVAGGFSLFFNTWYVRILIPAMASVRTKTNRNLQGQSEYLWE